MMLEFLFKAKTMARESPLGQSFLPSVRTNSLCLLGCFFLVNLMSVVPVTSTLESPDCQSVTKLYQQDLDLKLFQDSLSHPIYYRHLTIDIQSSFLFVGAMNRIFGLYLNNIENEEKRLKQNFRAPKQNRETCITNGKLETPDCQNHVRVLIRNTSLTNTFYMCSTGAYSPIAYQLRLENNRFVILRDDLSGIGICPYDPRDNSTSLLVERGNANKIPSLYFGTYANFVKSDPVISRIYLYHKNGSPFSNSQKTRTVLHRNDWLNEPQFVRSIDVGDHVYFFYREVALEYTNCGKKIYSRVARICKNDAGGASTSNLGNIWLSFVKARLNCSIPGEYPYYFDEIQDVYQIGDTFYGLFTTNKNGVTASAICAFNLSSINKAFNGTIKIQKNQQSMWLPASERGLPETRFGDCKAQGPMGNPGVLSQEYYNLLSTYGMLMDKAVSHKFGKPIFYQSNTLMQKMAVVRDIAGHGELVFFTASNTGEIFKIAAWPGLTALDSPKTYLVTKYIPFTDHRPIWSLLMHKSWIYFGTDKAVGQMAIETCDKYKKIDICIYDPYCGWDVAYGECHSNEQRNLINYAKIDLLSYSLEEAIRKQVGELYKSEKISKISGSSVTLAIEYLLTIGGNVVWEKNGSRISGNRHILAQDNSLIVTDIRKDDEGIYRALDENRRTVAEYSLAVETSKEQIEQRWMRKFDQWCDEFERYQDNVKQWERKCSSCCQESVLPALPSHGGK